MAIVGAGESTDTGTRSTPSIEADPSAGQASPSQQQQFSVDVQSPGYGWRLSPDDLGQGQVQQIRTDNFVTPVAEMRLPYGAIAARQQAVAEKRSRLEAAKQATAKAFDPFKGISDPAAQHQAAFKKYAANTWWPELVGRWATAHGVSAEQAMEDLYSTQEGNAFVQREAHILDGMAKESFGMTGRVADLLEKHQKGEITIFPEDMKVVENWMSGKDHNAMPISGERPDDFLWKGRELEGVMAFAAFQKGFLDGFDQYAQQHPQEIAFSRPAGAGGKVIMQVKDEGVFNDYKEAMVETAAEQGVLNGDRKRIRERLDRLIKDKYDVKVSTFDPYESVERRESAKAKADGTTAGPMITTSVVSRPLTQGGQSESVLITPWQVTGGKPHKINKGQFNSTRGSIDLYAPSLTWDDKGLFFIEGRDLSASDVAKVKEDAKKWAEEKGLPSDVVGTTGLEVDIIMERNIGKPFRVSASNNAGEMKVMFRSSDPHEVVAMQLQEKGFGDADAAFIKKNWGNPDFRAFVMNKLK